MRTKHVKRTHIDLWRTNSLLEVFMTCKNGVVRKQGSVRAINCQIQSLNLGLNPGLGGVIDGIKEKLLIVRCDLGTNQLKAWWTCNTTSL